MIDLLPPDFHGTDSEKLLQLTNYTWLLYDALSRKLENIGTQDLNPTLARIIMMIQNYTETINYTKNDDLTVNFNDNSLMAAFFNQNFMNIEKSYYNALGFNWFARAAQTSGGVDVPSVRGANQGDFLIYFGSVSAPITLTLTKPYAATPSIFISKNGIIEAPAFGQSSSAPNNSATATVSTITITGTGLVDFVAIGTRGGD